MGKFNWLYNTKSKNIPTDAKRAAFHESGHIVCAYFVQWAASDVKLTITNGRTQNAVTTYNFLEDIRIVQVLENPNSLSSLTEDEKERFQGVLINRCVSLLGGPIAEALFLNGVDFIGKIEIDIRGPDSIRSFNLERLNFNIFKERNLVQNQLKDVTNILKMPIFWDSISKLADNILSAKGYQINQSKIEEILNETGLINYINKLHKA